MEPESKKKEGIHAIHQHGDEERKEGEIHKKVSAELKVLIRDPFLEQLICK